MLARAKINLFLHVGSVQNDGYHPLSSLVAFANYGDELTCDASDKISLRITGVHSDNLSDPSLSDNLVIKAAVSLKMWAEGRGQKVPGIAFQLQKNLPVASGIGGGSADAAAALHLTRREWGLEITDEELQTLSLALGADVPVCVHGKPSYMSGIGETLNDVVLPEPIYVVLVNPGVTVSTAEIFNDFDSCGAAGPLETANHTPHFADLQSLLAFLNTTRNDLEAPAITRVPIIGDVLEDLELYGAQLSRMSGSGATCYGLFGSEKEAHFCFEKIALKRPDWWVRATTFSSLPPQA